LGDGIDGPTPTRRDIALAAIFTLSPPRLVVAAPHAPAAQSQLVLVRNFEVAAQRHCRNDQDRLAQHE